MNAHALTKKRSNNVKEQAPKDFSNIAFPPESPSNPHTTGNSNTNNSNVHRKNARKINREQKQVSEGNMQKVILKQRVSKENGGSMQAPGNDNSSSMQPQTNPSSMSNPNWKE